MNRYIEHPILNWSLNPKFLTHNELGFREGFKGDSKVIYCIGGSAAYCHYIDDIKDTWPYLIGKSTGHTVINGGVSGYTFLQSFIRFMMWNETFKPDMVIVYDGKNDAVPCLAGVSKPDYTPVMKHFRNSIFKKEIYDIIYGKRLYENLKLMDETMYNTLLSYYSNLKHICAAKGIRLIFIPQWTMTEYFWPYLRELRYYLKNLHNETILFDWSAEMFMDNTHFSVEGAKKFAEKICEKL